MLRRGTCLALVALLTMAGAGTAQLLPSLGGGIGQATGGVGQAAAGAERLGDSLGDSIAQTAGHANGLAARLARSRLDRLGNLVRRNPQALEFDARGDAAVKGELVAIDANPAMLQKAAAAGFVLVEQGDLAGLGMTAARLRAPAGMPLAKAEKLLARLMPSAAVQSNPLYQQSATAPATASAIPSANIDGADPGAPIGLIDGGIAPHPALPRTIVQRGFAQGAPAPGDHATAIASILVGRAMIRGVSPGSRLFAADVYGRDPSGGNALAIARALGWLVASGVTVVNISLAGPDNMLLSRAIQAADRRGVLIVAAVGNDGAAAPPAYPASYPQVIAVTGVDGNGRTLIEAGRAAHIDFAAPGADLLAANAAGGVGKVRGSSFAAPFVTARLARLTASAPVPRPRAIALLAAEARQAKIGAASGYGRGIVCGACATR